MVLLLADVEQDVECSSSVFYDDGLREAGGRSGTAVAVAKRAGL